MNEDFTTFRQQRGYSEKSIKIQNYHVNHFKSWCCGQDINPERITYNQVLQFIDNERERGTTNQSIINKTGSVRIYFDYLVEIGTVRQNIIKRIKIRNSGKKALPETLTPQQLENLYQEFVNLPEWEYRAKTIQELHKRNIVLLGLLVYQGLTSGDIAKLETGHINLMEGKIYIPSSRKGNSRTLKLQANQILYIKTYLEEFNPKPYLFQPKKTSNMICNIIQETKKLNPKIINSRQIRTSVIMNWLKANNIRQVQYMAGHRSIKSTENYRNQDLTDLSKQLELFHPLQ
jgi:integrase/recombinase XerD